MLALAISRSARADDVVAYEVEGEASAAAADPRGDARDDAFARAVTAALADLVAPDVRAARKADLDREIVGHARNWIRKFTVTRDDTSDGRRQLSVSVRVDRDKLRARLAELDIATTSSATPAVTPRAGGKTVAIVARADAKDPPAALVAALRDAGMTLALSRVAVDQPIDDAALADVTTDVIAIVDVALGPELPIRGLARTARLATAHVRLVDRERKPIGAGTGTGTTADRAIAAAVAEAMPRAPDKLAAPPPIDDGVAPLAEPGVVLVRVAASTPWPLVQAEQKLLAGARGVRGAALRRLSPRGWVIGLSTDASVDKVAELAKRAPTATSRVAVKIVDDVVELALSGTP
jgi:hypothetical protein